MAGVGILFKKKTYKKSVKTLEKNTKNNLTEPSTLHPVINDRLCVGCGSCVTACPEGEILQMINHKAVLVYATKCVGHGACEAACPMGGIDLVFGTKARGMEIPRITPDYETNIPGLYIAGELGGMGLIRNAIKQGRLAAYHAVEHLESLANLQTDVDVFVVGAGPAGFSAGLASLEKGVKYKVIDQNTFGGTIFNFPRQKIVTSHPLDMAIVGERKFKTNVTLKEDILALFNKIRQETKLEISERESFNNIKINENGTFTVETSKGVTTAKKVLLCMGVRGSPRKLGLPNEDMMKVTYNLIDPEDYKNVSVAIVGGGNAGLETAQYLAKTYLNNDVHLIVRGGPKDAFSKANEKNQALVFDLEEKKLVTVHYDSAIKVIEKEHIIIKKGKEEVELPNDFIFVFAGAEVPFKFLMSLGIQIDKAHGEIRKK